MIKENRYHALDSLRGIACLEVVIGHCLNCIPTLGWIHVKFGLHLTHNYLFYIFNSPLHFIAAGSKAVKLFFILSGFVLSLPYYNQAFDRHRYLKFFIKRILRLYMPCAAIIIVSLLIHQYIYNPNATALYGYFVREAFKGNFSGKNLINVFLLSSNAIKLDPPLWTIQPEIILSLILPFFVYLLKKVNLAGFFGLVFAIIIINMLVKRVGLYNVVPILYVFYYMSFFLIGAVLCKYRTIIQQKISSLSNWYFYLILFMALVIYTYDYSLWWMPERILSIMSKYEDYVVSIGAIIFIVFAFSGRLRSVLDNGTITFIGKISFSLYLVHSAVIVTTVSLLGSMLPHYIIIFIAFILCFPISWIFYKLIEAPSMAFAKKISDKV